MKKHNSLDQYLELLRDNLHEIEDKSPEIFNTLRHKAVDALELNPHFPAKGSENYVLSDINALYAPDFGININRVLFRADASAAFHCGVPNISTLSAVVSGDTFVPSKALQANCPKGLIVMSLLQAAEKYPHIVEKYLGSLAWESSNVENLNTAFLQDGIFILVEKNAEIERPLQLVNIFNSRMPMAAFRRVLIVAEENSRLKLLVCDHTPSNGVEYLSSQVVEVIARPGASIEYYDIEETSATTSRTSAWHFRQEENSSLVFSTLSLSGGNSHNAIHIDLAAQHASAKLSGLVIATDNRVVENNVLLSHSASECASRQIFKYALFDNSQGAFGGKIIVKEHAARTDAAQTNRNLLIGSEARMQSNPQLEIYCDDVKASHGATTGQLDARALFYMQSRGIPEEEARKMLVQAFMNDILNDIELEPLRDRLKILVEKRLDGDSTAACGNCAIG